ncbi:C-C motif chemokine 3-like [Heterocephalus glaber]|uniref:C-C motif chemokine n=1 Tax=Heterocephalus glaber TaxID=10181 RepID=A0AAX6R922_HETGA|nr:C-C motif chemokine 3-like [Heterocephalus glaber]
MNIIPEQENPANPVRSLFVEPPVPWPWPWCLTLSLQWLPVLTEELCCQNALHTHPPPTHTVGADTPTACCFSYAAKKIPRPYLADYHETSSQCSQPGVIFVTKKGRQVCADPSEAWVQEYINDLELNA